MRVIPRALLFVLLAALMAVFAMVATPPAHASGTYTMKPDCYNSGTWAGLIKPWAQASRQSPDFGCFATPLQVLEAQCTFLVTNGNASDCALFSPPPPITAGSPPSKGYNLAHGGTQGTAYWDVEVGFFGRCTPPAVQTEGLACSCPANTAQSQAGDRCVPISVVPEAQAQPCDCAGGPGRGNPLYPLRGTKRERVDLGVTIGGLPLALTYDSSSLAPRVPAALNDFGGAPIMQPLLGRAEWSASFVRRLVPEVLVREGEPVTINAVRGDGTVTPFDGANGHYMARPPGVQRLDKAGSGYYVLADPRASSREFYTLEGALQRIEWADGRRVSFGYSDAATPTSIAPGPGYLITLTDQLGRQLRIAHGDEVPNPYDPGWNLPKRITLPDGSLLRIQYNNQRSISGITWPDGRSRSFLYENERFLWALTGIVDERNVRYATFGYDDTGVAVSSVHVGGVDSTTVSYGTPPAIVLSDEPLDDDGTRRVLRWRPPQDVVVTGPNGTTETWSTTSLNGHNFLSSRTQVAGAGSAAGASAQTFDAMGNLASSDDADGRRACYLSDAGSGLQTMKIEGLSTQQACDTVRPVGAALPAGARKTSTQWHPGWGLPVKVAEPTQLTTSVYHGQPDPLNGNAVASCAPASAVQRDGRPIAVLCKQVVQATTDADGHLGFDASLQAGVAARITTWTYNALGQVLTAQGPRPQDATSYGYHTETNDDHRAGDLASVTDAKGQVTRFDRYDALGQLLQVTDPNGVVTAFSYDARQRLLSRTVGTETTSYSYDAIGQLTRVTPPDGTWVGFEYDDAHRRTAAKDSDGNRIDYALDNAGNRIGETVHDPAGILARSVTRVLDALDRVQQERHPGEGSLYGSWASSPSAPRGTWVTVASEGQRFETSGVWRVRYGADTRWAERDMIGTVYCSYTVFGDAAPNADKHCERFAAAATAPAASPALVTRYEYDGEGHVTRQVQAPDGLNLQTQLGYDALARPVQLTDPKGGTTSLTYDGADRTTQVTDPRGLATQYARNGFGETTQLTSPDTGSASQTYDEGGNLTTLLDSRGVLESYTYDELNRLTTASFSQAGQTTQTLGWRWDLTGDGYANSIGRLSRSEHPDGSARFQYDPQGRVTQAMQTVSASSAANAAAVTTTVQYGYTQGRLTSVTYPSGRQLGIQYSGRRIGALALAPTANGTATPLLSGIQWEPFGPVRRWQWAMTAGAMTSNRYYDQGGRLQRYRIGDLYRDLSYDAAGRLVGFTHSSALDGTAQAPLDQAFGYDENSRLTLIATAASMWNIGYDANGNRTGMTLNGEPSTYGVEATSNRTTSVTNPARSLVFDNAGNTLSDSATDGSGYTATYNLRGQLATINKGGVTTTYSYDAEGRRVRKVSSTGPASTVLFVYDLQGQLLGEYGPSGQALREYVWLENAPVAMFTPDPALADPASGEPLVYFIHTDHLDAPRLVVDRSNRVRWRWLAEPFGTTAPEVNPSGLGVFTQNLRFPGQYADQESGLFYNYFRYYNSVGGGYSQSDPIGLAGGINTYAYVGGNPLSRVDPDGRFFFLVPLLGYSAATALGDLAIAGGITWWATHKIGPSWPTQPEPGESPRDKYEKDADACYEQCKGHLEACGPGKDLQASDYRRCFRRCMFDKGHGGLPPP